MFLGKAKSTVPTGKDLQLPLNVCKIYTAFIAYKPTCEDTMLRLVVGINLGSGVGGEGGRPPPGFNDLARVSTVGESKLHFKTVDVKCF